MYLTLDWEHVHWPASTGHVPKFPTNGTQSHSNGHLSERFMFKNTPDKKSEGQTGGHNIYEAIWLRTIFVLKKKRAELHTTNVHWQV